MAIDTERVRDALSAHGYQLESVDFHALDSDAVLTLVDIARAQGYRKPRNANGSRARYFFYAAQRKRARELRKSRAARETG